MASGVVFDIKEFTVHDGPGIRTTVFLKGCPLRCKWCHNPEGLSVKPQLMITKNGCLHCGQCRMPCDHEDCAPFDRCVHRCPKGLIKISGEKTEAKDLAKELKKQAPMLIAGEGGITVSGGEPLMQPEFLCELLEELRPLHRMIETSGYAEEAVFRRVASLCDMVYMDIKHFDPEIHKSLTGVSNEKILNNLAWLKEQTIPFVIRTPMIPGCNDTLENMEGIAKLVVGAKSLDRVELMPYNPFAKAKYEMAEMEFLLDETKIPKEQKIPTEFLEPFKAEGISVTVL